MPSIDPSRPARIAVVDDHQLLWSAVAHLLAREPDLAFVGGSSSVDEALALGAPVDVVLLAADLRAGGAPGAGVERLRAAGVAVVGWSAAESPYGVRGLLAERPDAVVDKTAPGPELVRVLRSVATGTAPDVVPARDPRDPGLSPQEAKVLALFADGAKLRLVAFRTGLAYGTVEDYVRRIRAKYHRVGRPAGTKTDLLKRAVEDGYLPVPRLLGPVPVPVPVPVPSRPELVGQSASLPGVRTSSH